MHTLHASSPDDIAAIVAAHPRVLVDFHKDNCPGCTMLGMALERFGSTPAARGTVLLKARLEDLGEAFFRAMGLRQTPTLVLYCDGSERERLAGFQSPAQIAAAAALHFRAPADAG